jgi:hypothetical protein
MRRGPMCMSVVFLNEDHLSLCPHCSSHFPTPLTLVPTSQTPRAPKTLTTSRPWRRSEVAASSGLAGVTMRPPGRVPAAHVVALAASGSASSCSARLCDHRHSDDAPLRRHRGAAPLAGCAPPTWWHLNMAQVPVVAKLEEY